MPQVRMHTTAVGPTFRAFANDVVEVSEEAAKALVAGHFATRIEEATVRAPEHAVTRPKRGA